MPKEFETPWCAMALHSPLFVTLLQHLCKGRLNGMPDVSVLWSDYVSMQKMMVTILDNDQHSLCTA